MVTILADILSLAQYLKTLEEQPDRCRLEYCGHCGKAGPWHHGHYYRKADRSNPPAESLNPVPIFRFFCPDCRHTSSALPECIPPRRWYLWEVQQAVFLTVLAGKSLYAAARLAQPSRQTIGRWIQRFQDQFRLHKDTLGCHRPDLGRTSDFTDFWSAVLRIFSLGQAMRLCHVAGVLIP
jgi:transposase-like protein